MKVVMLRQWRGHDKGTMPDLTDERAAQLIREGYAKEHKPKPKAKPRIPVSPAIEVPKPKPPQIRDE